MLYHKTIKKLFIKVRIWTSKTKYFSLFRLDKLSDNLCTYLRNIVILYNSTLVCVCCSFTLFEVAWNDHETSHLTFRLLVLKISLF